MLKTETEFDFKAQIIVTTIGSFMYYLRNEEFSLESLKLMVLDETDKLFNQDFGRNKLAKIFSILSKKHPECRIGMFSATFPKFCLEIISKLNRKFLKIEIEKEISDYSNLTHYFIKCSR